MLMQAQVVISLHIVLLWHDTPSSPLENIQVQGKAEKCYLNPAFQSSTIKRIMIDSLLATAPP